MGAALIDLFLISRVFVTASDPWVGVLTFFIFGATTGALLQGWFAGSSLGRSVDGGRRDGDGAAFGGNSTMRPSTGRARSWMLKPVPSLCGNATPMRVQERAGLPSAFVYSSTE